jgi:Membrane bound beta barrel domain (DUF5777)
MKRGRQGVLLIFAMLCAAGLLHAFARGPLPKLAGGFGENTCINCHGSHKLNDGRARGGTFEIVGAPKAYVPGYTYPLKVVIGQPGQSRWGFELSARFAESGKQAGQLVPSDDNTRVVESDGVRYIEHTVKGTHAGSPNGPTEYHFNWIAPDSPGGLVLFNGAGNAANSDNSPNGDFIYSAGAWSEAEGTAPQPTAANEPVAQASWGRRTNTASRIIDLPAPAHLPKHGVEMFIQHRFFEGLSDSRPGDAFGIDSGANINLAVNYGITDRMSLGVSRARDNQIIALTGTYEIQTRTESPWKMSLVAGVEGERNFERQYSPFVELTTSYDWKGVRLFAVPTAVLHSRDRELVDLLRSFAVNPDSSSTLSMGLGADVALSSRFSLVGEVVPRLAGFGGIDHHRPTVSAGLAIQSWGHVFTILVSSSRDFTPAEYAVNPEQKSVSLGFNIYRRMARK